MANNFREFPKTAREIQSNLQRYTYNMVIAIDKIRHSKLFIIEQQNSSSE